MKHLKVLSLITLSACLLLAGCGKEKEVIQPVVEPVVEAQPELQEEATPEPEEEEDLPPEEGMVRSPITNEWISGDIADARPIAIMVPNDKSALPHYNLSKADVLYECPVEADLTRSMAVIKDWEGLDRIGNVRSCRDYFVYWALEYDAIYVHFGGPFYITDIIEREGTDNITGCFYGDNHHEGEYANAYFRSSDRKAPHNAYASADGLDDAIEHFNYSKTYRDNYYQGARFPFAKEENSLDTSDAFSAKEIDLSKIGRAHV